MNEISIIEVDYNVNNNIEDVQKLINIQHYFINSNCAELTINFTESTFINAAVLVLIGTLAEYARLINKKVKFKFKGKDNSIFSFMKRVGIYDYFTNDIQEHTTKGVIPFNKICNEDMMEKYTDKIMELAPIQIEPNAKDILSSYFYEVYQNAFYHSDSKINVFSCGHWMPEKKELIFSIYDMGIGIPENIKRHVDEKMSNKECIEWAFTEGKSTIEEDFVKRGLGLTRLEEFVKLNGGSMSLYTENICCIINKNGREFNELQNPIKGTLIIINIRADNEHIYIYRDKN